MIKYAVVAISFLLISAGAAQAQSTEITITKAQGGVLKITANGAYTLQQNWTVQPPILCKAELANGQVTSKNATYNNGAWNVTMDVAPGTYKFTVTMTAVTTGQAVVVSAEQLNIVVTLK